MSDLLQLGMAGLVILGYIVLWRIDGASRSAQRIQQAARRNVAEYKRTVTRMKQRNAEWGNLNQARHELNNRYAEAIKTRNELNERYSETIDRMRAHHGVKDAESLPEEGDAL